MGIKEDAYKMLSIALPRVSDQSRPIASFTVIYYPSDLLILFLVLTPSPSKINFTAPMHHTASPFLSLIFNS